MGGCRFQVFHEPRGFFLLFVHKDYSAWRWVCSNILDFHSIMDVDLFFSFLGL